MNKNLKVFIWRRQKAFTQNNRISYKELRNKINWTRKNCRKMYCEAKVKELKQSKPKDWWRKVKRLCGLPIDSAGSKKKNIFSSLEQDIQNLDFQSLSNLVNNSFLEPIQNYSPLPDTVLSALENDTPIVLTEEEVLRYLNHIKPSKSNGPDNIPNWILRRFADLLAAPVTAILNASFDECRVPSVWKLANVCPIPKCNRVLDINRDLRPISLTSSLCKIAEEVVITRNLKPSLLACIDPNQFGFIPGSSTTLALISLIHRWTEAVD